MHQVVGGLGPEKLHRLMPDIIATAERSDIAPHVKDGYIMMFIFLPTVFQDEFTPYIGQIIPPILKVSLQVYCIISLVAYDLQNIPLEWYADYCIYNVY